MKEYDLIAIGTGSVMSVVEEFLRQNPNARVAVIDKDEPGGICLTRGCIPTKILLYSAELVRTIERAHEFGVDARVERVRFPDVMHRMRQLIGREIDAIRQGLTQATNLDYYPKPAEFSAPYTLKVDGESLHAPRFLIGAGSEPVIPPIRGLESAGYLTSDTVIALRQLPGSLAIIGGGYIAAELGHFFAAMGSSVTILGRNPQFLPGEEAEVSAVARRALGRHMRILTGHEVVAVEGAPRTAKRLTVTDHSRGASAPIEVDEVLVAAGRGSTSHLLHPERAGLTTDGQGWIQANERLETSQPNIWVLGDATGHFQFKHKANYDARIVYEGAVLGLRSVSDYHAVPHAVFTDPEVASVGLGEHAAEREVGIANVLVGYYEFANTAKGEAMNLTDYFVKILMEAKSDRILGAHIVGPYASVLIQEVVNLMYTKDRRATPAREGMHIHPALSEVVERAFLARMPLAHYREHVLPEKLRAAPA